MSPITPEWALSGAKINIFFEITNIFQEKLQFTLKKVIYGEEKGRESYYSELALGGMKRDINLI